MYLSTLTETFKVFRPNSTFLSIRGYKPLAGGRANYIMCFRSSYPRVVKVSLQRLQELLPEMDSRWNSLNNPKFSKEDFQQAYEELENSLRSSKEGTNERGKKITTAYEPVVDADGQVIHGIKLHSGSDILELSGIFVRKEIVEEAPKKKPVNHGSLTLAKSYWRRQLPIDRWVQFTLEIGRFDYISVGGLTFEPDEVVRWYLNAEQNT